MDKVTPLPGYEPLEGVADKCEAAVGRVGLPRVRIRLNVDAFGGQHTSVASHDVGFRVASHDVGVHPERADVILPRLRGRHHLDLRLRVTEPLPERRALARADGGRHHGAFDFAGAFARLRRRAESTRGRRLAGPDILVLVPVLKQVAPDDRAPRNRLRLVG